MKTLITTAIVGALAFGYSAMSVADSSREPQATVQYGDLDLSTPQGASELYSRITTAADHACTSYAVDGRSLVVHMWLRSCVQDAVANAVAKIGEPALFAVYDSKHRKPVSNIVASAETR